MRTRLFVLLTLCLAAAAPSARGGDVQLAVAANFTAAAREIGARFERASGHRVVFSFASTGQLYTHISQGAPFEVFLAADRARPRRAVQQGLAVAGSRFTYAVGHLVLYSEDPARVRGPGTLRATDFTRLAIANPVTAPYGAAAVATLKTLDLYKALTPKLVYGNSIAQTYQFVATGNAELGLVALSQVAGHTRGSRWRVPQALHPPIAQDAVLLQRGAGEPAARAFLAFLRSPAANAIKRRYGYGAGD